MHHERDFCAVEPHTLGTTQESRGDICQQPGIGIKGYGDTIPRLTAGKSRIFSNCFIRARRSFTNR